MFPSGSIQISVRDELLQLVQFRLENAATGGV
jgi:hypothetical protein